MYTAGWVYRSILAVVRHYGWSAVYRWRGSGTRPAARRATFAGWLDDAPRSWLVLEAAIGSEVWWGGWDWWDWYGWYGW